MDIEDDASARSTNTKAPSQGESSRAQSARGIRHEALSDAVESVHGERESCRLFRRNPEKGRGRNASPQLLHPPALRVLRAYGSRQGGGSDAVRVFPRVERSLKCGARNFRGISQRSWLSSHGGNPREFGG